MRRAMRQRYPGCGRNSIASAGASSIVTPLRGSRGEARCSRSTTADHGRPASSSAASSAASSRGTKPTCAPPAWTSIALASCSLSRIAPELERAAGRERVRGQRVAAVPGPRQPGHVQPSLREQRRVAREVRPGLGIDELVPRQPDLAAVVGVPVALGELDAYLNERILNFLPTFEAYCPLVEPVQTR